MRSRRIRATQAAASPTAAEAITAVGAVAEELRTFSATLDAAAAAATEPAFTDEELGSAGGLDVVLAFFLFFKRPNDTN